MATMLLADMGAEVIKIEDPNNPDYVRNFPPFIGKESAYYLSLNHTKRSLALDFNSEKGKEILKELIKTADVFIEQYRPGVMKHFGLDYETLKAINPQLVYISITGFGQESPYSNKAGHDLNYIGYGGLLDITGTQEQGPIIPGGQIADLAGGAYMTMNACMAALLSRVKTGKGQHVDVSMTDCIVPLSAIAIGTHYATNENPVRGELALSGGLLNYNVYKCADGKHIALGTLEPKFWERFCDHINKPDWKDILLDEDKDRHHNIKSELEQLFLTKPRDQWTEESEGTDFCLSPVLAIEELENDPHIKARNLLVEQTTAEGHSYRSVVNPLKFIGEDKPTAWNPPALGEDTIAILKELGRSDDDITSLIDQQVIGAN